MVIPKLPKLLDYAGRELPKDLAELTREWASGVQDVLQALKSGLESQERLLAALTSRVSVLEAGGVGGITPAYFHVFADAAVQPNGTTWEGIHNRYTLQNGEASGISRSNSTFTFTLGGRYLWVVTANFTSNTTLMGFRIREGSTTLADGFFNTINNTTNQGSFNAIVQVDAAGTQDLQIVVSAASNNLPQQTLDSEVVSNLNVSIVRISAT